jgi:NAD(P)-dependent dehydrogenase (short-subunit alcohol dehydrogenase family)
LQKFTTGSRRALPPWIWSMRGAYSTNVSPKKGDEIASAALFLASEESAFVTGTELFVDGGAAQV